MSPRPESQYLLAPSNKKEFKETLVTETIAYSLLLMASITFLFLGFSSQSVIIGVIACALAQVTMVDSVARPQSFDRRAEAPEYYIYVYPLSILFSLFYGIIFAIFYVSCFAN